MALSKEYFKAYNYRGKVIDVSGVIGHLERGDLLSARKYLGSKKIDTSTAETIISQADMYLLSVSNQYAEKQKNMSEGVERNKEKAKELGVSLYEYKVLSFIDSNTGLTNTGDIEGQLNILASEGWRIKGIVSNELGKNALSLLGIGINGTVDQTIIVLERDIRFAE